jgi:hypothetical protein
LWEVTDMKRLIISPLVLALVLVSSMSASVEAAGSVDQSAGVDLTPSGDVAATNVVPVVAGSAVKGGSLWAQVDDGTSFSAADDSATLVRTRLRFKGAEHTTSYAGAPSGTVTDVVVNLRAARSPLARGTARVRLYDGSTLLGSSAPHALTEAYTNFSDDFGGLSVADASNLRTTVKFTNTSGKGELFYTALWLHAAYQTASDTPPSVSILSPTDGAAVSGPIVVSGTSGDDVGVSSVSLRIDGGAPIALSTAGTWIYPWDTTGDDGTHQLTVTATDTAGLTRSQSITVVVGSAISSAPPPGGGYFSLQPAGSWSSLPDDSQCASMVHRSTWEPRPANYAANHTVVDPAKVSAAFAGRPLAVDGNYDSKWDTWLLPRVDGQFSGTTDEIFQWAACKWGLPDNLLRGIAVRESTWYQYLTYPSGRPVNDWGSGDLITSPSQATITYCDGLAKSGGYDYQKDYGTGICPETFSIAGVMDWEAPSWGVMPDNQNGTFPFNRDSTAFAVDYLGSQLRGCYEGWEHWLGGAYAAGDIWGCVGLWYAGDWHSATGDGYTSRVQNEISNLTWLRSDWASVGPGCSATYGCP